MVWMCTISTKKFQLSSNGVGVLDSDQKGWGLVLSFWEKKIMPGFPSLMTKKFGLPFDVVSVLNVD